LDEATVHFKPTASAALLLIGLLLAPLQALAGEAAPIVVIPIGEGPSLYPTARVARSITLLLNRGGKKRARLAYPVARFLPEKRGMERKAMRHLKRARRAFQMMEFGKVKANAEKALKLFKQLLKSNRDHERYVEAQHILAAAALFAGDSKAAQKAMNDAYIFDPNPPAKKQFSPQVQELYQQVRNEPPQLGAVRLDSTPKALVWFNNQLHGPASGTARLRAGLYLVRFFRPGHAMIQRWFRVHPNKTRDLEALLTLDATATEPEIFAQLRRESREQEPGTAVNQVALDLGASELIMVKGRKGCTEDLCKVRMYRSKDASWLRKRNGVFKGKGTPVARLILKKKRPRRRRVAAKAKAKPPPRVPAGVPLIGPPGTCSLDSQCGLKEVCRNYKCVKPPTPITRKWWFWTLVGAVVAGATVAIVVPVTRPDAPVIEVQ
jgi:hypothetical protein